MDMKLEKSAIQLAVSLLKECFEKKENELVSPLSVMIALAMTANGAEGTTKEAFEKFFGGEMSRDELNEMLSGYLKSLPSDEKCRFQFADSIWLKDSLDIKDQFKVENQNAYDAEVKQAAFNEDTKLAINSWVNEKTEGMIKEIIDSVSPEAIMYLINALVFDAEWLRIYSEDQIHDTEFTNADGSKVTVSGMYSKEHRYFETEDCTGFLKPYAGNRYSFMAMLPKDGTDIQAFVQKLDAAKLIVMIASAADRNCNVMIPKFITEYSKLLNDVLGRLGLSEAFSAKADFSGISDEPVCIGEVIHKTYMETDERGTKAGAVTAVMMKMTALPEECPEVYLNRPFVYAVVDNETAVPLFIGVLQMQEKALSADDETVKTSVEPEEVRRDIPAESEPEETASEKTTEAKKWWQKLIFWKK